MFTSAARRRTMRKGVPFNLMTSPGRLAQSVSRSCPDVGIGIRNQKGVFMLLFPDGVHLGHILSVLPEQRLLFL